MSDPLDANDPWFDRNLDAGRVFTPTSPIDERSLFAGRRVQVQLIIDVVNQKGQHAVLFGERGVGKTSLANVLSSFFKGPAFSPRVNCDSSDTFDSVWRKVFGEIRFTAQRAQVGFNRAPKKIGMSVLDELGGEPVTPDVVKSVLFHLSRQSLPIIIIDEFDRLAREPRRAFADTVKMLSDHAVPATLVMVGVGDAVEQLIEEHKSVERALVQIQLPRMSANEIEGILNTGVGKLNMSISPSAVTRISKLSQGLPHYAHLLGLHASRAALDARRNEIVPADLQSAVKKAIGSTQLSVRTAYDVGVRSPRKDNLFKDVLLACAMAATNELGYFAAQDVRGPLQKITGRPLGIPTFAKHLNGFCEKLRGPILHKDGTPRLYRYRFVDPLVQPFIIMRGSDENRISLDELD